MKKYFALCLVVAFLFSISTAVFSQDESDQGTMYEGDEQLDYDDSELDEYNIDDMETEEFDMNEPAVEGTNMDDDPYGVGSTTSGE